MRDRASMVVPSGVPDYLKFKSKRVQTAILAKNKVRDDILCTANVTAPTILKGRFSSTNFIDPQSVRLVFTMTTSANAPAFKFHNDAGANAIIKSLRVTSGSTPVEFIANYNLLMTMLYSVSVSQDWKKTLGWVEGFGTDIQAGTDEYNVTCPDYTHMTAAGSVNFALPIHSGLFSMNERLIPNSSLNLILDIELAGARSVFTSTAGNETYVLNNVALEYDEYVVSEAYSAVYQQALLNLITFDYTTFSNINIALATGNTINTITTDSQKQLRSIYTIVRDSAAIATSINQTDLESIAGSKMSEFQYRIGTQMMPLYKVKNLQEAFIMTLDSFNRANIKRDDYPLTYSKYNGNFGRRFFVGVDVEKSKTSSSEFYSGVNTNALQLQFTMTLNAVAPLDCIAGSLNLTPGTTQVANGAGGFTVDHFLLHDRILTIGGSQIIVDY